MQCVHHSNYILAKKINCIRNFWAYFTAIISHHLLHGERGNVCDTLGFFKEAIGQGTSDKRKFGLISGFLKINLHEFLNWQKKLTISASSENEITQRGGKDVSKINFFSHHTNASINAELIKKFFIQASYKQLNAKGNEFVTQRDNYGNISYFTLTDVDQKDHMLSVGMLYKFKKNLYAKLNYSWWGMTSFDQNYLNYKYNRLLLILSVKL